MNCLRSLVRRAQAVSFKPRSVWGCLDWPPSPVPWLMSALALPGGCCTPRCCWSCVCSGPRCPCQGPAVPSCRSPSSQELKQGPPGPPRPPQIPLLRQHCGLGSASAPQGQTVGLERAPQHPSPLRALREVARQRLFIAFERREYVSRPCHTSKNTRRVAPTLLSCANDSRGATSVS